MEVGIIVLIVLVVFAVFKTLTPTSTTTYSIDFDRAIIIDVRSPQEFAGGHVKDAINLPIDTITEDAVLNLANKDQPIVLYCHSGGRASIVGNRMTEWGFSDVHNLKTQSGVQTALNQH